MSHLSGDREKRLELDSVSKEYGLSSTLTQKISKELDELLNAFMLCCMKKARILINLNSRLSSLIAAEAAFMVRWD
ncbi:Spo0E family sporulation regulatory protein-aspartic acid phosphatase [Paenibacillus lignilyticus]|uniref:Aspartyl-phosphate phosphatase Spo0E family protein n=1 Tax=Paenibacillus lignilyticus TaxID=1172615 RepID=A0ABS5CGT3_9BACL|nr:aspartyl-phosphate phosphatase Spo0E family protein [Paenibacillus lignilyticus]